MRLLLVRAPLGGALWWAGRAALGLLVALALGVALAVPAHAQSPAGGQIPYQGFLTDAAGTPLTQTLEIEFALTDGGGSTWSETALVDVTEGAFTHYLGSVEALQGTPGNAVDFAAPPITLTLTIDPNGTSPETVGPVPLGAVPTAYYAIGGGSGNFALPFSGSGAVDGVGNGVFSITNTGTGDGLEVERAGEDGVSVGRTGGNGLTVQVAGDTDGDFTADNVFANGVEILSAGGDGISVGVAGDTDGDGIADNTAADGVGVFRAGGSGVEVESAGGDGMYVGSAGGDGVSVGSASVFGLEVSSAGSDGVNIGSAGGDGVDVVRAGGNGFSVEVAGDTNDDGVIDASDGSDRFRADGVSVGRAGDDGVFIERAGAAGVQDTDGDGIPDSGNGVRIGSTAGNGISVGVAGDTDGDGFANNIFANGIDIGRAGSNGFAIGRAGRAGFSANSTSNSGVFIGVAGDTNEDGVADSEFASGFRVDEAGGNGLSVREAGANGVDVFIADENGLRVENAGGDGVQVEDASDRGIEATGDAGNFLRTTGTGQRDADLILGGTADGPNSDNGVLTSDPAYSSSDLLLVSNDVVAVVLNNDSDTPEGDGSEFVVQDRGGTSLFSVDENGDARANSFTNTSDARLKQDVATVTGAEALVEQLRGVSFRWKERPAQGPQLGFLAQEVRAVLPHLVRESDDGTLSVQYDGILPLLVEALKAQQARIDALEAQAATIDALRARLDALEARTP